MSDQNTDHSAQNQPDTSAAGYRVLARKYRPDNFSALIGQDALVKTLSNAIAHGRLAHAFVLTGVRGVGKTSTARILAKGLNCIGPDGTSGPTLEPCGQCEPCTSISASRHVDVLEMDAASNTGVDDVRDIIDGAAYRPVSARFKIYIIDEVHMLSKNAFNALLKTLEEPPEAVKFIFATTEIRKVPVTILSRCQRFDLRRVSVEQLAGHLRYITDAESIKADEEALHQIAKAAEGSVRDSLSLLDQAAAMSADHITASSVGDMLGHAGDAEVGMILTSCLSGDITNALAAYATSDNRGSDPESVISDMLDLVHYASLAASGAAQSDLPEATKSITSQLAEQGIARLGRAWQILLKGHLEVKTAPNSRAAAQMLLIRLAHSAPMPTPAEIIQKLPQAPASMPPESGASASGASASGVSETSASGASGVSKANTSEIGQAAMPPTHSSAPSHAPSHAPATSSMPQGATAPQMTETAPEPIAEAVKEDLAEADAVKPYAITSLADAASLLESHGHMIITAHLRNYVRPIAIHAGHMEIFISEDAPKDLAATLAKTLSECLSQPYLVTLGNDANGKTLYQEEEEADKARKAEASQDPLVKAVIDTFEGAEVSNIIPLSDIAPDALPDDGMSSD